MEEELFIRVPTYASMFFPLGPDEWFFEEMFEEDAVEKIQMILKNVCHLHKLPLALTWTTHRDHDHLHVMDAASYINDSSMQGYVGACAGNSLKKGQSVAGKAVNLMRHHSVPNVSSLDLVDYPFVYAARNFGLRAAMAVRLKRKSSGKIEYVSEIFLPTNLQDKVEQDNLIVEILLSLHKNCEDSGTVELQIESLPCKQAVAESSLVFPNVGSNSKETIQNSSMEIDEPHEQATARECELSEPAKQSDQTPEALVFLRLARQHSSCGGFNSNEKIIGETDGPNELEVREQNAAVEHGVNGNKQVAKMHNRQLRKSINKPKKTDTRQIKCTHKPRKTTSVVWEFFDKVQENGEAWAKCPDCHRTLRADSKNGTSNLHKHGCFKKQMEGAKQQSVSNVETQVGCPQTELTAEDGTVATSTTSSIPITTGFPVVYELRSFLSQSPEVLLSPTEIDRFCSLLNAAINAVSNEWEKHPMRELLAEVHWLKEAITTCPPSTRPETLPQQGCENLTSALSESDISRSNLEADINSLKYRAARMEEELRAINERRAQKEQDLSLLEKNVAVMQNQVLQNSQDTVNRIKIENRVAGMSALFEFVKSRLPKP